MEHHQRKRISYSQNFLIGPHVVRRIIDRSTMAASDLVIEIGPGRGALTRLLAAGCRQVIAIEKDPTLARRLGHEVSSLGNVVIFEGDFLDFPLPVTPYTVVANIPFNVTAAIMAKLTRAINPPEHASLVVQREAAERFTGQPRQTLVSLLLQPWFELSVAYRFRQRDFVPPPRVDVVLLHFSKRGPPLIDLEDAQEYRDFITFGFTAWKPTIAAAYASVLPERALARMAGETGLNLGLKPSEATLKDWITFFRAFRSEATSDQRGVIAGAESRLQARQAGIKKRSRSTGG